METLIGDVFRNAARAVPHREAARVGDRSLTFAELDREGNRHAQRLAGHGHRAGRPGRRLGRHLPRRPAPVRGLRQARRRLRPGERRGSRAPRPGPSWSTPVPDCSSSIPSMPVTGSLSAPDLGHPLGPHGFRDGQDPSGCLVGRSRSAERRQRRGRATPERRRSARDLLHERQHRTPQGRDPLAPGQLVAVVRRSDPRRAGRDGVHVPAVPHVGLVDRARLLADPLVDHVRTRSRPPTTCSTPAHRPVPSASTASQRCGDASSTPSPAPGPSAGRPWRHWCSPTPAPRPPRPS